MNYTNRHKVFNQEDFKNNDKIGREAVKSFFKAQGIIVRDNPDIYGIDLFFPDGIGIEIDHKDSWDSDIFPWKTVIVTCRKEKYFKENFCFHAVVNKKCTLFLMTDNETIIKSPKKLLINRYVPEGEWVWEVPLEKFEIHRLKEKQKEYYEESLYS